MKCYDGSDVELATSYPLDHARHLVGDVAGEDGNSQERIFDDSTSGGILVFFKIKDILPEVAVTHTKTDMGTHIDFIENFRSELIIPVELISSIQDQPRFSYMICTVGLSAQRDCELITAPARQFWMLNAYLPLNVF